MWGFLLILLIGLVIGILVVAAEIYYHVKKEKHDSKSRKIYTIITVIGVVTVLCILLLSYSYLSSLLFFCYEGYSKDGLVFLHSSQTRPAGRGSPGELGAYRLLHSSQTGTGWRAQFYMLGAYRLLHSSQTCIQLLRHFL